MDDFTCFENFFIEPEHTNSKCNFGDIPLPISFEESNVCIFGIPVDITTTFGKTASFGPQAIRMTSANQIETYVYDKKIDFYENSLVFDLGDLLLPPYKNVDTNNINEINLFWKKFDNMISKILSFLLKNNKKPIILGGEHTITYYLFKEFSKFNPLFLHFDAHRDLKPIYNNMEICHTTPFYHLINEGYLKGKDLAQIGIRQTDKQENIYAIEKEINTFDAWTCNKSFKTLLEWIKQNTKNRNIYISFDIDVFDIPYVPCTGTPEPYGLNPFQINDIINSIDESSNLIGMDLVETGLKNEDYREGSLATQTLLRILSHKFTNYKN